MALGKFNMAMTGINPNWEGEKIAQKKNTSVVRKKFSDADVLEIRKYYDENFNGHNKTILVMAMAVKYDKTSTTIRNVINKKSHTHL